MALGLLGGMLQGGGQAIQQNAQSRIQARHDKAMQELQQEFQVAQDDKQWGREKKLATAEMEVEGLRRQEDRLWEVSDSEAEHQRDIELQKLRNQGYSNLPGRGGRSGDSDLSRTDVTTLISQLDSERETAAERLQMENPGMTEDEVQRALSSYDQRRRELQQLLPGGGLLFDRNQGDGQGKNQGGSGVDWSAFFD